MTYGALIARSLLRNKARLALLVFAVLMAFLIYGLTAALGSALSTNPGPASAKRLIVANRVSFTQPLPLSDLEPIRQVRGVAQVTHVTWFGGYFQTQRNFLTAFAVDPGPYLRLYPEIQVGSAARQAFLSDRTGILVGEDLAKTFGWRVGDHVPLGSEVFAKSDGSRAWAFTVDGIFRPRTAADDSDYLLLNYAYLNDARLGGRNTVGQFVVQTASPMLNEAAGQAIDQLFANSAAATKTQTEDAFNRAFMTQFGNIGLAITLVVSVSFLSMLVILGSTMISAFRERFTEVGVLKTLGFSTQRVFVLILSESVSVSLTGAVLGLALAWMATAGIRGLGGIAGSMVLQPASTGVGLLIALLLGLFVGLGPAIYSTRISVAAAVGRR